jgi:hypothetical protein
LRVWFRLTVEVLPKQVPADASFGFDLNAAEQAAVRIFSAVPIHWDRAALLRRLPGCRSRSHRS